MDLTIPGDIGGEETLGLLKKIDPEVKAIVSSGYSNNPIMAKYKEHGFIGVISKPFYLEDVSEVLSRINL
jgi:DNA-binding NtrC family response regulator